MGVSYICCCFWWVFDGENVGGAEAERDIQKKYWAEHSIDLTVEAMMLDSKASDLNKEERPEVYSPFYIHYLLTFQFSDSIFLLLVYSVFNLSLCLIWASSVVLMDISDDSGLESEVNSKPLSYG